jgi:hypothetical protein
MDCFKITTSCISDPPLCCEMLLLLLIITVTRDMGDEPHRIRLWHGIALRCNVGTVPPTRGLKTRSRGLSSPSISKHTPPCFPRLQHPIPKTPNILARPETHPIVSHPSHPFHPSIPSSLCTAPVRLICPPRNAPKPAPPANDTSLQPSLRLRQGCLSLARLVSSQAPPDWFRSANTSIPRRPIR